MFSGTKNGDLRVAKAGLAFERWPNGSQETETPEDIDLGLGMLKQSIVICSSDYFTIWCLPNEK